MLIGICGGICAGKHAVQDFLVREYGFTPLILEDDATPDLGPSTCETDIPHDPEPLTHARPTNGDNPHPDSFATPSDLVDYATTHWQANLVTTSIHSQAIVDALSHRPFFLLLHIDAPLSIRWQRFRARCTSASRPPPSLEQFVSHNDAHLYSSATGLASLASRAQIKLLNTTTSLASLTHALRALNLTDPSRMRPSWDHYFMTLASLAARRANCMRRQVGCVLTHSNRVLSTGYNGTPRHITNCNEGGCPRCNDPTVSAGGRGLDTCLCIHAEENALLEAGRERIGSGAVLYCNTCPCLTCTIKIVQVGIAEVVYSLSYHMDAAAADLFREAGVKLRQFSPPKEGLVNLCDARGDDFSVKTTGGTDSGGP